MKVVKCENGHFYDIDKYKNCPHCFAAGGGAVSQEDDNDKTISYDDAADAELTVADWGQNGGNAAIQKNDTGRYVNYDEKDNRAKTASHKDIADEEMTLGYWVQKKEHAVSPDNYAGNNTFVSTNETMENDKTVNYREAADNEITANYSDTGKGQPATIDVEGERRFDPVVGWLVCTDGPEKGRDYRLFTGRNFIGRSINMDVNIAEDGKISRENHCSVIYDPRSGEYFVLPGESTISTLNEKTIIKARVLNDGDILGIGDSKFCFIGFCREGRNW